MNVLKRRQEVKNYTASKFDGEWLEFVCGGAKYIKNDREEKNILNILRVLIPEWDQRYANFFNFSKQIFY